VWIKRTLSFDRRYYQIKPSPLRGGEVMEEHPIKGEEIMDIPTGKPEEPYTK
jgi:hypothetical protein